MIWLLLAGAAQMTRADEAEPVGSLAAPYQIVRRDGGRIAARAMFRIEGDEAVYLTPAGERTRVPLAEIDLEATLRLNQPAEPATRPVAVIPAQAPAEGAETPTQEVLFHGEVAGGVMRAAGDVTNRGGVVSGTFGRYTRTRFFRIEAEVDPFQIDVRFRAQRSLLGSGRYYQFTDNHFREDQLESLDIRASLGKGAGIIWTAQDRGLPDYLRRRTFESEIGLYFQVENYLNDSAQQAVIMLGSNLDFALKKVQIDTRVAGFVAVNDISASRIDFSHSISWPLTRSGDWRIKATVRGEWLLGNRSTDREIFWRAQAQLAWRIHRQRRVLVKAMQVLDTD